MFNQREALERNFCATLYLYKKFERFSTPHFPDASTQNPTPSNVPQQSRVLSENTDIVVMSLTRNYKMPGTNPGRDTGNPEV